LYYKNYYLDVERIFVDFGNYFSRISFSFLTMASVSRLDEFRQKAVTSGVTLSSPPERRTSDTRIDFLRDSDDLRCRLDTIDVLVDEMNDVVCTLQSVTTSVERKIAVATFEATVLDANTRLRDAKNFLDTMQKSNIEFQEKFGQEKASEWGFRTSAVAGHAKRLRGLFTRIATCQTMFESEMSRRFAAQGVLSPESTSETPFTPSGSAAATPGGPKIGKAFANVAMEEQRLKQDDMKRVEKSLREIREAFLQIAALVESQGEMIDCIEFSVVNAKNYSHQANIQLIKARRKQRQRSMLWCFCGIILTLAVVFGILGILQVTGAAHVFGGNR